MTDKKNSKIKFLINTFDVMFIMILCFVILLSTMLFRGAVIVGANPSAANKYSFGIFSFLITFVGFIIYLAFIIPNSNKELKNMVNELYTNDTDLQEK